MYSNGELRSGWDVPSRVLRLAYKLYPACRNNRATVMWLTGLFDRLNSAANLRVLLQVQRNGERGSPRVAGSTNTSKAFCNCGSRSVNRFRPLPGRRIRRGPVSTAADRNSRTPERIVLRDKPVAAATALAPPQPNDSASVAAHRRRALSSNSGPRA